MVAPIRWAVCFAAFLTATETARPRVDVTAVRASAKSQAAFQNQHDVSEDVNHEDTGSVAKEDGAANAADDVAHGTHMNSRSTDGAANDAQVSALTSRTRLVDTKEARAQASLQKHPLETKNAIAHEDASVSNHSSFAETSMDEQIGNLTSNAVTMYSGNDTSGCDLNAVGADLKFIACKLLNGVVGKLISKAIDHIANGVCGLFSGQMAGLCGQAATCAGCAVGLFCPALAPLAIGVTGCACYSKLKEACVAGVKALLKPAGAKLTKALTLTCTSSKVCFDTAKFYSDYGAKMENKIVAAVDAAAMDWCSWVKKEANALMGG